MGVALAASPASSDIGGSFGHLWNQHIKPKADKRYANAVKGTDKAKNTRKVNGQRIVAFSHVAAAGNISGLCTYLDHPLLNGNPTAHVMAIHEFDGTYYDKTIGVYYSPSEDRWCVFSEDTSNLPTG